MAIRPPRRRCRAGRTGSRWPRPEALDPGDAPRGVVDPLRRHVRRHGLEQSAAHEPARWLDRRDRRPSVRGPGRPSMPTGWPVPADAVDRALRDPEQHARLRGRRPGALPVRPGMGLDYADVTPADIVAGLPGIDVLVIPDGFASYAIQALGAKGKRALATGSTPAAAWSPGRAAPRSRRRPVSRPSSSPALTPTCPARSSGCRSTHRAPWPRDR